MYPPASPEMYLTRFQTGFLDGHQANGAFVACGPPGFTALALINLAEYAQDMSVSIDSIATYR